MSRIQALEMKFCGIWYKNRMFCVLKTARPKRKLRSYIYIYEGYRGKTKWKNEMIMLSMKERLKFSVDVVNCAETMTVCTERGGSVVTHETRIREVPGSNPGADQPDCGFPRSTRQMLGWIFITTIHLTIIHQIHIS